LLGPLSLNLEGIDWIIVGGESGHKHRPIEAEWVRDILRQSQESDVAFFFKQWGGNHSKAGGRILEEKIWEEMPDAWYSHVDRWQDKKVSKLQRSNILEQKYLVSSK
jgi:protein gp37